MKIDISTLLLTGALGELAIGSPLDEVRACLGEPEAVSTFRAPMTVWKYGDLQLHWVDNSVRLIVLHFHGGTPRSWTTIEYTGWIRDSGVDVHDFKQYASSLGVSWEVDPRLTFDDQVVLRLGKTNVSALFMEGTLEKIVVGTS